VGRRELFVIPEVRVGDEVLLFDHLPFDYAVDLPLTVGPGVYLQDTPQELLGSLEQGLARIIHEC